MTENHDECEKPLGFHVLSLNYELIFMTLTMFDVDDTVVDSNIPAHESKAVMHYYITVQLALQ